MELSQALMISMMMKHASFKTVITETKINAKAKLNMNQLLLSTVWTSQNVA